MTRTNPIIVTKDESPLTANSMLRCYKSMADFFCSGPAAAGSVVDRLMLRQILNKLSFLH
jgi:hypothetical protein